MLIQAINNKPIVALTDHDHRLEHFLRQTGFLTVTTNETEFNFMLRLIEPL